MPRLTICLACRRVWTVLELAEEKRRRSSSPIQCHLRTLASHSLRNWGNFVFRTVDARQGCWVFFFLSHPLSLARYHGGWIPFKAVRVSSTRGPEVDRGDPRWNVNKARQERLASNEQRDPMVPTKAVVAVPWDSIARTHNARYDSLDHFFFIYIEKKIPWHTADQRMFIKWPFFAL